jgi:hypothetical protein
MNTFQKYTTALSLSVSILLIGLSFGIGDYFLRFLLVGELPGSATSLPPDMMLLLFSGCFFTVVLLSIRPIALARYLHLLRNFKQPLPKRRYGSIQ